MVKSKLKLWYKGGGLQLKGVTTSNSSTNIRSNRKRNNNTQKRQITNNVSKMSGEQLMKRVPVLPDDEFPTFTANGRKLSKYGEPEDEITGETRLSNTPDLRRFPTGSLGYGSYGSLGYGGIGLASRLNDEAYYGSAKRRVQDITSSMNSTKRQEKREKFELSKELCLETDKKSKIKPDELKKKAEKTYVANRGKGVSKKNKMFEAKDEFFKVLLSRIVKQGVNQEDVSNMFVNIGNIYREVKEYDAAILCFKSALRILMTISGIDISKLSLVECFIAETYYMKNEKEYAEKAVEILSRNRVILASDRKMDKNDVLRRKIKKFSNLETQIRNKHRVKERS